MTDAGGGNLAQVYELINREKLDDAVDILHSLLEDDPTNADGWWLLANAVNEPDAARAALQKVLEHNPQHAEAQGLLDQLDELYPPVPEAESIELGFAEDMDFDSLFGDTTTQPPAPPTAPEIELAAPEAQEPVIERLAMDSDDVTPAVDFSNLFDLDDFDDEPMLAEEVTESGMVGDELPSFDDDGLSFDLDAQDMEPDFGLDIEEEAGLAESDELPTRRRPIRRTIVLLALILVVVVAVVLAVILLSSPPADDQIASVPPTDVPAQNAPEVSDTVQLALDSAEVAANAQADLLGGEATTYLENTSLGVTLILRICRAADTDLSTATELAMQITANYSIAVQDEIDGIGVDLINCGRDDVLLTAIAPIDQAVAYAEQSISAQEFRVSWLLNP